ncbi:MAG TPA: transglutaminase-like domain-containing protein [Candidatus Kapabacteria bacterium]|nr:transglutaminase-like domain-containing protein [Candidatus Kapabacteria bacterium]
MNELMNLAPLEFADSAIAPSSQIDAILSLLDDPDPIVQGSIRARLLELGDLAAPALRRVSREGDEELARVNAESTLKEIGLRKFRAEMRDVIAACDEGEDINLERGAFAVALIGYPELRVGEYRQQLDTMAAVLESRLRGCDNGYMVVREFNFYMFEQLGYQGCRQDKASYFDPENSYVNRVMDRRTGIPIALSTVYLLVARRLGLPFQGVGFPARYLVKYRSASEEFFIDPFKNGSVTNYSECRRLLRDLNVEFRPEYLEPVSDRKTVARMMRNLVDIYSESDPVTAHSLQHTIADLVGDEDEERDDDNEGTEEE